MATGISLLVCTRDRAAALARCLDAIAVAAGRADAPVELVLVDNGSSDNTSALVSDWAASNSALDVTIVDEPVPGLSRARNAGLARARYDIVAMTDDDCLVREDYFARVLEKYVSDPTPRIIGGRVELGDPMDLPITIKTDREPRLYRSGSRPGGFIMGANFTMHREVVDKLGPFDERFGAGGTFKAAEDTDYIVRADLAGYRVEYSPDFVVDHYHGRRGAGDAMKLSEGYYFGDGALYAKHLLRSRLSERMLRAVAKNALRELAGRGGPAHPTLGERAHIFMFKHLMRGFGAFVREKARPGSRGLTPPR